MYVRPCDLKSERFPKTSNGPGAPPWGHPYYTTPRPVDPFDVFFTREELAQMSEVQSTTFNVT